MAVRGRYSRNPVNNRSAYMEQIYFIKQYNCYCELIKYLDERSNTPVFSDKERVDKERVSNPTEQVAFLRMELEEKKNIIEKALTAVPVQYRDLLMINIIDNVKFTDSRFDMAHVQTWKYWKNRFVWEVANLRGNREYLELLRAVGK